MLERGNPKNWQIFLDAYQEHRPLAGVDLKAVPWFVAARYIWIFGLHVGARPFIGSGFINDMYWNFWMKLLRKWDEKELET